MTNKKHKLSYSNANWDVIHARQEKKWAQRSGEVVVIKPADPEKRRTAAARSGSCPPGHRRHDPGADGDPQAWLCPDRAVRR